MKVLSWVPYLLEETSFQGLALSLERSSTQQRGEKKLQLLN